MDYTRKTSRRSLIKAEFNGLSDVYPSFMQLYKTPPTSVISFQEFEQYTAERLSVLQTIDDVNNKGLKRDEWRKECIEELKKQPELRAYCKLITATSLPTSEENFNIRKQDHVSHFVLRLAYCDTEEKRRWYIGREVDLFKLRWMYLSHEQRNAFLAINELDYDLVSQEDKVELSSLSCGMVQTSHDYFKVPFRLVSDLVRNRNVFLRNGFAYVSSDDIISVLISSYRAFLSQCLTYASRRLHTLDEDDRLFPILRGAGNRSREVYYTITDKEGVQIADLDTLSESSFPLCMQHLHRTLRKEHHLKHFSRLQYGLFLKGIGVTLEDSLKFWRKEFTKNMDPDKFERSYSYGIRYNYGKEGKRANYSPHSCIKIISSSVNPGDHHGCPFRHWDPAVLRNNLISNGLSSIGAQEVVDLARKGHYQLACGKYFGLKLSVEPIPVNHPNHYFDESQNILFNTSNSQPNTSGKSQPNTPSQKSRNETKWFDESGYDFSSVEIS